MASSILKQLKKTGLNDVQGYITWKIGEEYQEIRYSRAGDTGYDAGINRKLFISSDMQQFAIELNDGRIIATTGYLPYKTKNK